MFFILTTFKTKCDAIAQYINEAMNTLHDISRMTSLYTSFWLRECFSLASYNILKTLCVYNKPLLTMSMALIEPIILWPLIANFGPPLYLIGTSQLRVCILVEQLEVLVRYSCDTTFNLPPINSRPTCLQTSNDIITIEVNIKIK